MMLTPEEIARWQARWKSQNEYLTRLVASYSVIDAPRKDTFQSLVECLQQFGKKQFDFFATGFSEADRRLDESDQYPPQFALSATIEQIGLDMALIEQAASQRIQANNWKESKPEMLNTLTVADKLAYSSLTQLGAGASILREPTTVLTYFQKSASVRVIPYAPVVLVAIPFSSIHNPHDMLAIPHEVGHYVYRHGRFAQNGQPVSPRSVLPNGLSDWCKDWFEEIFADVFGTLIAGPVIALDFQDLQLTLNSDDFITNDGDHPVANLRPYLYIKTLEETNSHPTWAMKLRENWEKHLEDRGVQMPGGQFKMRNGHLSDIADAITVTDTALPNTPTKPVDIAMKKALGLLQGVEARAWVTALPEPAVDQKVENLYTSYEEYLSDLLLNDFTVPDLTVQAGTNILHVGVEATSRQIGQTLFPEKIDEIRDSPTYPISVKNWLAILDAAGWTTQGPQCETTGGVRC